MAEYKYYIDDEEVTQEEFESQLEKEIDGVVEANYDDLLDDCYKPYKIGTLEIYASDILSKCDPVAYRCGMADEKSYQMEEAQSELDRHGETTVYSHFEQREIEEEDEEETTEENA